MTYSRILRCLPYFIFSVLFMIISMSDNFAYSAEPDGLTLDDCIAIALENNLGLRSADISVTSGELDYDIARSPFDPTFAANLSSSITRRGGISLESQISGGSKSEYMTGDFEFAQQLFSGGRWSVKYDASRSNTDSTLTEGSLTAFQSQTTFTYTHPLLEGSDTVVNRIGLETAVINSNQQKLNRQNVARELIYQVKVSYYNVLNSREAIDVAELSFKEANTLLDTVKAKLDVGWASAYEVMAAESGLASREESLLLAKTEYQNNLDSLKNLMNLPLGDKINVLGELKSVESIEPDYFKVLRTAKENRPDWKQIQNSVDLSKINIKHAKDLVKSSLALVGQVGLEGEDTGLSGAIGGMDNLSWYLGLNYSVPLGGNRRAKAELRQAELALEVSKLSLDDKIASIELELTRAIRNLETAKQRLVVTSKGVELQEEKLKMEKARYDLGLITSGELLDFEEDLATARFRFLNARADFMIAVSYLEYVTNAEKNHFINVENDQK